MLRTHVDSLEQLVWLGLSPGSIVQLRPYVTVLPEFTKVNLNTAPAVVLRAVVSDLDMAGAQQLVQKRDNKPWDTLDEFNSAAGLTAKPPDAEMVAIQTRFFEVRGTLELEGQPLHEIALMQRDGQRVKIVRRQRSAHPRIQMP